MATFAAHVSPIFRPCPPYDVEPNCGRGRDENTCQRLSPTLPNRSVGLAPNRRWHLASTLTDYAA